MGGDNFPDTGGRTAGSRPSARTIGRLGMVALVFAPKVEEESYFLRGEYVTLAQTCLYPSAQTLWRPRLRHRRQEEGRDAAILLAHRGSSVDNQSRNLDVARQASYQLDAGRQADGAEVGVALEQPLLDHRPRRCAYIDRRDRPDDETPGVVRGDERIRRRESGVQH